MFQPAVSSLIVPPNGLIYFRVDCGEKKAIEQNMQIVQFILHFIFSRFNQTNENSKPFCAQLATPLSPFVSLKVKNCEACRLYVGYCRYHLQMCTVSQNALRSQCRMFSESQVLCFPIVFGPTEIKKFQKDMTHRRCMY